MLREEAEETSSQENETEEVLVINAADLPGADSDEQTPAVHRLPKRSTPETSRMCSETNNCLPETFMIQAQDNSPINGAASSDVAEAKLPLSTWSPEQGGGGLADGEWAVRSTSFIGPMCRPQVAKSPDMEDKLSEFYKELEQIGSEDNLDVPDKPETPLETEKYLNTTPKEETKLKPTKVHRPYHRPHPYLGPHGDQWYPRRCRDNLSSASDSEGWGAHNQDRWQHSGVPLDPPFSGFHGYRFYRPNEGLPPPPPGPFYQPDFGPQMPTCYIYPETVPRVRPCEWDRPFPPSPGFTAYDGYSDGGYPPYHFEFSQGNSSSRCTEDIWYHSSAQGHSGLNHHYNGEHKPQQQHHPRQEHHEPLDSDVNHQMRKFPPYCSLVLILMRGLPGSGKSTLAQELRSSGPSGLVLSTDDYFCQGTGYAYNPSLLGDAHEWNQKRAREAMDGGRSPVIIDNTNMQAWEMKPYAKLAIERGYRVEFCEPTTSWRRDPLELEKRNKHRVPQHKIAQMLERFELPMSLDIVLNSQEPPHRGPGCSSAQARKTAGAGPQSH